MSDTPQIAEQLSRQDQTQTQTQTIEISVNSAGDLDLESRIFREVHSVGRQLARLSDALWAVIQSQALDPTRLPVEGAQALASFRKMRADIQQELDKKDRDLLRSLQALKDEHPDRYAALAPKLRQLVDAPSQPVL